MIALGRVGVEIHLLVISPRILKTLLQLYSPEFLKEKNILRLFK